jgi:HK97 family phage prohead protease
MSASQRLEIRAQSLEWRQNKAPRRGEWERRQRRTGRIELRDDSDEGLTLTGYASLTETPYDVGFYSETISRGAFKRTLSNPDGVDVQLLVNHTGLPLARTTSGTLTLSEDDRGLKVVADLDPTDPDVRALEPKMRRGDVTEMSFAFRVTDQDWSEDYAKRRINSLEIHRGDVSVVSYGASPTTNATLRAEEVRRQARAAALVRPDRALETQLRLLAARGRSSTSPARRSAKPLPVDWRAQYEALRRKAS